MLDIKEKITEIVNKIKGDDKLQKDFQKDPESAVEKLLGVDIPDDMAKKVIEGVKAKLAGDKISGVLDSIKKKF